MKAFPHKVYLETTDPTVQNPVVHAGMDLRDYFAAKVLSSLILDENMKKALIEIDASIPKTFCKLSYEYADEMMKAREQ